MTTFSRIVATRPDGQSAAFVASNPPRPGDLERLRLLSEMPGLVDATWQATPIESHKVR